MEPLKKNHSSIANKVWRVAATGFCFALFGLGGLFLSTVWFSFLRLVVKDDAKRNQMTQDSIRNSFKFFLNVTRFLRVLDYKIHGAERFTEDKGCLVVANHPSLLDYVLLASCMPRCDCIVKKGLLNNFFMRGVIKAAGYIPNADSESLLTLCQNKLEQGGTILIFPEGTRTTPGTPIELQRGAANIALRCHVNIRIVTIYCDQSMLTKQEKWYNIPATKPTFTIRIEKKIDINKYTANNEIPLTIAARHLTDDLAQLLDVKA